MPFMEKQIEYGLFVMVETLDGTCSIPVDVCGNPFSTEGIPLGEEVDYDTLSDNPTEDMKNMVLDYIECYSIDRITSMSLKTGFGARLSAPGYMDCTEWTVFNTEDGAEQYLHDLQGEDEEEEETED